MSKPLFRDGALAQTLRNDVVADDVLVRLAGDDQVGLSIPHWDDLLEMAARCCELAGLGYIGVDFVLDRERGPLILELNARAGLAIQIANGNGLLHRLRTVETRRVGAVLPATAAQRAAYARSEFPTLG